MALTALEQDTISRGMQAARQLVDTVKPALEGLNVIYNGAGGVKETVTQEDLDSYAAYSGLTKSQLDDGMYAMTATLLADLTAAFAQLQQLAARA